MENRGFLKQVTILLVINSPVDPFLDKKRCETFIQPHKFWTLKPKIKYMAIIKIRMEIKYREIHGATPSIFSDATKISLESPMVIHERL